MSVLIKFCCISRGPYASVYCWSIPSCLTISRGYLSSEGLTVLSKREPFFDIFSTFFFLAASDEFEGCHPQRKLVFSTYWRVLLVNYTLDKVSIQCSAPNTVFDIRYSNNLLCVCGRLVKEKTARSFPCRNKTQDLNVNITVSVDQVANNHVETCNVTLRYVHFEKNPAGIPLHLTITIPGRDVVNPAVRPSTTMSSVVKTFNVAETTLNDVIFTLAYTSSKFASRTPSYDSTTIPTTLLRLVLGLHYYILLLTFNHGESL